MSEQELVSVIVPVYKAEEYLRRCIQSIQKQTYRNLEIILVDDGSPDKSPQICDRYAQKDRRIHVIHQKNAGVSSARNAGIEIARGGFLTFIDADDWIPPKAIETLVQKMTESNADLVCGNYTCIHAFFYHKFHATWNESFFKISDREALGTFLPLIFITPWAKLYRGDIIREKQIEFTTWMKFCEDANFVLQYLKCCERVATISENVYFWSIVPPQSGSKRYVSDTNKINAINQELKISFFDRSNLPIKIQCSLIVAFGTGRYYVELVDSKGLAIQKIKETYELFREMLTYLHKDQLLETEKEGDIVRFYRYLPLFEEGKYEEIYDRIKEEIKKERKSKIGIQKRIAVALRPLSCFLVYRLNWFYHK